MLTLPWSAVIDSKGLSGYFELSLHLCLSYILPSAWILAGFAAPSLWHC